jgi:hypothetical protein
MRRSTTEALPKICFSHRKISDVGDVTDLVALLLPGNRNQQHAAARILMELKNESELVPALNHLQDRWGISRRTLERTRAKLCRLGLIEHVSWMNSRYGGGTGWKLSGRFASALRRLAEKVDVWRKDCGGQRREKEELLVGLLQP